jgi:uncharacterized protein with PIN domain
VTKAKAASVRFYFDADILGLAKVIAQLRPDVTYPGDPGGTVHRRTRPACPIAKTATNDDEWIPVVAEQGWLIVTRDRHIQERRAELAAVRDHNARMVALAGAEATGTWAQLEVLMTQWRRIEALLAEPAPLVRSATRTQLRAVPLS